MFGAVMDTQGTRWLNRGVSPGAHAITVPTTAGSFEITTWHGLRPVQEAGVMRSVYSVREGEGRQWCITRDQQLLHGRLCPGVAISLARQLAREDHDVTGKPAHVEFLGGDFPIVLARYGPA